MRAFIKDDVVQVNGWLTARKMSTLCEHEVPKFGMIEEGVACGFLLCTDIAVGFLECFVTNPDAPATKRHHAIDRIGNWAIGLASTLGIKQLVIVSSEPSMLERAKNRGFKLKATTIGSLDL